MKTTKDLQSAIESIQNKMRKYSNFGACDGEASRVFRNAVQNYLETEEMVVPSQEDWELYDKEGWQSAARTLSFEVLSILSIIGKIIAQDSLKEYRKMIQYLGEHIL